MSTVIEREHARMIAQIREYMRQKKLTPDDLIEIGGEDLRSVDPARAGKARCVEKCWALMARSGVKHIDLAPDWAPTAVSVPTPAARRRRNGKPTQKPEQNQEHDLPEAAHNKPNEINDLAIRGAFGGGAANSGQFE